jgi:hypothetical protein
MMNIGFYVFLAEPASSTEGMQKAGWHNGMFHNSSKGFGCSLAHVFACHYCASARIFAFCLVSTKTPYLADVPKVLSIREQELLGNNKKAFL